MTTLISFLGKQTNGYNLTSYKFADGTLMQNQKYMGLALYEKIKPQRLILLGTSGSMWDVFLDENSQGLDEEWLALVEAVNNDKVNVDMLKPFSEYLTKKFQIPVECILISNARSETEQIGILTELAQVLPHHEQIVFDITHSYRHLPLICLVAARFLKLTHQIDVKQIFYGNFIYGASVHPVLELKGLITMLDWIDALSCFDKDGDYGVFASLLEKEGLAKENTELLKQAAFFERTTNSSNARQKLTTVINKIAQFETPIFGLFKNQLLNRLTWFKKENRGLREQQLALEYLHRHDYLRAVIYAMEGMISHQVFKSKQNENDFDIRKEQQEVINQESDSFNKLRILRNALAHGVLPRNNQKTSLSALEAEEKMQQSLISRFKHLLD